MNALRHNGVAEIDLEFIDGAMESSHETVLPISAPTDSSKYNEVLHGPKPSVTFDRPVHRQIRIIGRFRSTRNQVTLRQEQLAQLEEHSSQLEEKLTLLKNSISWRITRPLREVKAFLRSAIFSNKLQAGMPSRDTSSKSLDPMYGSTKRPDRKSVV